MMKSLVLAAAVTGAHGFGFTEPPVEPPICLSEADVAAASTAAQIDALVLNNALGDLVAASLPVDITLTRVGGSSGSFNGGFSSGASEGEQALTPDTAGFDIYNQFNPEAAFYLNNAGDDSLVRDMQGTGFKFPTTGNLPASVEFELPEVSATEYSTPADLLYMPILKIATLIQTKRVSCVTVVKTFTDRLHEFDPYLGIVATPLYVTALAEAAAHDVLLNDGISLGPLMCIPFGIKDHHQVDDKPTMYGSLLHAKNVQNYKSSTVIALRKGGAIPIAKMMLGTFAWSSANGWGECMSPYLNGPGCGSSCGSASGAALGALPFAISEETSGSIACPASANLVSGHIASYGLMSRGGAGLLCSESDHLGFHTRFLSDFGVILNYARSGKDKLDGDTVSVPFENPAKVDVTKLKVLIIEGDGKWITNGDGTFSWNNELQQSYGKTAWHWTERINAIKAKLTAAGVPFDVAQRDEAKKLWSFDKTDEYFGCATPQIDVMMATGPWAQGQEFEYAFQNSKWKTYYPKNVPAKALRYTRFCMVQMGTKYLNDGFWDEYDVILDAPSSAGGNYDQPSGMFEQWVRTAKTFVMDYYEKLPCATKSGDAVEGAFVTLTAKPFEDYKNFAIGALIQDTSKIIFPDEAAIKRAFEGRSRCPFAFYEGFNNMTETCPALNSDGAPPSPSLRTIDDACTPGSPVNHIPFGWANEAYVAPYLLEEKVPDRALWRWDEYGPVACTAICPFAPTFCELKGITCDARRLAKEKAHVMPASTRVALTDAELKQIRADIMAEMADGGTH
ncbi:amidase signature domain-containing protein [Pelagophyceae sp. CCMP2097]|nr:amidase signature domain-containing protein [Pelagophyceae sp. CCMP2097]